MYCFCDACVYAVSMLGCEGDGTAGVGSVGGVVAVSVYMGGICGLGVLSCVGDMLEMSVVRGVCGFCGMCMCLTRGGVGGVGGEWVTGLGLGVTNSGRTCGKWICVCVWLRWCGWCWEKWVGGLVPVLGGWGVVMSVCVVSMDYLC